jgi:hypothetical protein
MSREAVNVIDQDGWQATVLFYALSGLAFTGR